MGEEGGGLAMQPGITQSTGRVAARTGERVKEREREIDRKGEEERKRSER